MNRRQKIIVSITGIFIVLLALVGLTYAYFLTRIRGNSKDKSISVTTANLEVTYNDDMDGDGEPDPLMIFENIQPSNTTTYTKTFKVENTGNAAAKYSVVLDNIENDFERNQDLKYTLTRTGTEGNVAEGNLVVGTRQIILPSVEIAKDITHIYTLSIKYIETGTNQSVDMGKSLSFRVNIDNETVTWDTASEGTLLYAIKNNVYNETNTSIKTKLVDPSLLNGTDYTIPGREASREDEAIISSTEDDYGTSYYYRGNVDNNYVTYSNMCWRIVRVQGDGTIKLVLADWEHPCGTANGYDPNDTDSAFIADENKLPIEVYYNKNTIWDDINVDINFIFEDNNIPIELNEWMNKINLDTSKLALTDWCNDISVSENIIAADGSLIRTYSGNKRFESTSATPTLKCNIKGLEINGNITKSLRYKDKNIAILTKDEILFNGGINNSKENKIDFLYNNANKKTTDNRGYFTLTPWQYQGWGSGILMFENKDVVWHNYTAYIRPSIVLKNDVLLSVETEHIQDGTIDKPYVID